MVLDNYMCIKKVTVQYVHIYPEVFCVSFLILMVSYAPKLCKYSQFFSNILIFLHLNIQHRLHFCILWKIRVLTFPLPCDRNHPLSTQLKVYSSCIPTLHIYLNLCGNILGFIIPHI